MEQTLYERLGGTEGIGTVVDRFYQKVLADDRIKQFFEHTDMEAQRRHQTLFLAHATGGPAFSGRRMELAHKGMNLQPVHFNAVTEDLVTSLQEAGVSSGDIEAVVDRVNTLKDNILYQ